MKRAIKQLLSLFIAIVTILNMGLNGLYMAHAITAIGAGDGTGGTGTTGGTSEGTWSSSRVGIRIYMVDSGGNLVSNIVDFVHDSNFPNKRGIVCLGIRGDGRYQGYPAGSMGIWKYATNLDGETILILPTVEIKPDASKKRFSTYARIQTFNESTKTFISHGKELRNYMVGSSSERYVWLDSAGGGGGDVSFEYEGAENTLGDAINKTIKQLWNDVEVWAANPKYEGKDIKMLAAEAIQQMNESIKNADNGDGYPLYSDYERQTYAAAFLQFMNELKTKIDNGEYDKTTDSDSQGYNIDNIVDNLDESLEIPASTLLDIAYGEETSDDSLAGLTPIMVDGGILDVMEYGTGSVENGNFTNIFRFKSVKMEPSPTNPEKGSVLMTAAKNGFIVYMEPIFYDRLNKLNKSASDYYFYGTVSNYGNFIVNERAAGGWTNGDKVGGNLNYALHKSLAWSMYTEVDLEETGINKAVDLNGKVNYVMTDEQLNQLKDYGVALHYYKFKVNEGRLPQIPTYNWHDKDPNPEPHKPQHPGDPTVEPPGTIPLTPGEPTTPEEYKKTTRTINIVKVYDTELIDGTRIHNETWYQENCPSKILVEHEPEWKAIEWYSSPYYYNDEHEIKTETEWTEMKDWVTGKGTYERDLLDSEGNVEKHISIPQPTDGKGELLWDDVKDRPAKDIMDIAELAIACDCAKEQGGEDADPRDGQHYWDTTLYVHLLRKEKVPETSTYDEPDHQPSGTPPAVPPHPSQDPHEPEDPNFDPETDHVEEDNIYCHYRIVKCYETITITDEGEQPPEPDGVFTTYKTNPVVKIQDEAQSADPFDGSWHLEDWDISDDYNPPLPDLWDPLTGTYSSKQGGHSPTEVNLIDKNDAKKEVTLYVHLVRRIKEGNPTGAIIIQQSQISKTIHTDDPNIGGYFGNYKFIVRPPSDFPDSHTAYYHHCCVGGDHRYHTCKCLGHTCYHKMPGRSGCNSPVFNFDLISAQDDLEIKKGVNVNTDPKVYGKSGAKHDAIGAGVTYNETISSLKCEADKFTYVSDGNQQRSAEYVTILWRGSPKYKDVPTLAKYKEKDIQLKFGSADNYNIPKDVLASGGTQPNKKSMHKRASQYWVGDLKFTFGLDEGKSHLHVASSCVTHNGYNCVNVVSQDYIAVEGTTFTYDFQAGVAIRFYAGKAKGLVAQPFGAQTNTPILEKKTGTHKELNVIQCKQIIHFYPYIRMTYMLNNLKDAEDEEKNTDANGYVNDVRKDTYVLSEHESTVLPADAVRVEWRNDYGDENLILTSQQWSVHQKAINGVDGNTQVWNGRNQVLPGGAIYQLSTPKDKPVEVILTTYQTVIDQKARNEYLSDPIPSGDEYTEAKVAKDHTDFINDAKEVFDNLKVVQWVNKNPGASTAWAKNFEEKDGDGALCLRGLQEKLRPDLGQDMKETANTEQKYYMRQQTTLSDYQNSKLSEWTRTIDQKQSIEEQTYEGDLDVFNMRHAITVYKLFTDASTGKVYLAQMEKKYSNNDTAMDNNEADIKSMVQSMKDLNADTYSMGQTFGATVTELCDKKIPGTAINNVLSGDAKDIDDATSFITNFVSALTRNKGTDYTAEWANGKQDGRWYNEAFDGAYLVRQRAQFNVGFAFTTNRVSALDPALCPPNKGQSDLYTKAFLSQFCVDSQSDATIAQGKVKNYLGTFKDTDITLPDMESLYVSKRFYIPNANVQDLN